MNFEERIQELAEESIIIVGRKTINYETKNIFANISVKTDSETEKEFKERTQLVFETKYHRILFDSTENNSFYERIKTKKAFPNKYLKEYVIKDELKKAEDELSKEGLGRNFLAGWIDNVVGAIHTEKEIYFQNMLEGNTITAYNKHGKLWETNTPDLTKIEELFNKIEEHTTNRTAVEIYLWNPEEMKFMQKETKLIN